jgi:DNA-binding transcriptional LysR family regulator
MLDLRSLRHFLNVAQHKSFVRAANDAKLTQPALSKSIRALESELGVRLFDRTRQGVLLTAAGEILLRHAKLIAAETKHAVEALSDARLGVNSQIVIGCAPTVTETLLPLATHNFLKRLPNVQLQICSMLNDELIASLRRGDLDVVFGALPHPKTDELVSEVLFVDPVSVVVRYNHPLAKKKRVTLEDLLLYPWVLFGPRVYGKDRFNAPFVEAGLPRPTVQIESNSAAFNKELISHADFLGYLPYDLINRTHEEKRIVALNVRGVTWDREVGITYRRRGSLSHATEILIEEIKEIAGGRLRLRRKNNEWRGAKRTAKPRHLRSPCEPVRS